jgi:cobalamin biosynthesis protein CobD/CbiB
MTISIRVIHIITVLIAVTVLILAKALDLLLGGSSPNSPWEFTFKLYPTMLTGKLTKTLEPYFKSPNPKIAKLKGVFLALTVIIHSQFLLISAYEQFTLILDSSSMPFSP